MKQLPKRSGAFLFEIIMRRHEGKSTLMNSNRPLEDWGKLIGDVPAERYVSMDGSQDGFWEGKQVKRMRQFTKQPGSQFDDQRKEKRKSTFRQRPATSI